MSNQFEQNERGVVSIITVIFVSIILTVLTTSFIRLTINEQRESTDDDLTTRAYYAAESGVQDAIAALKTGVPTNPTTCTPETSGDLSVPLDTGYTCQTIEELPTDFQAPLVRGQSVSFKLNSQPPNAIKALLVSWDIQDSSVTPTRTSTDLPRDTDWVNSGYPAMLRTQVSAVNNGSVNGSDDRDAFATYVGFLNPSSGGSGKVDNLVGLNGLIDDAVCNGSVSIGDYVCTLLIKGLDDVNNDYVVKFQALYNKTDLKIIALSDPLNLNSIVGLIGAQVIIDVTGRASDVYRRVEERVVRNTFDLWPDYAILSAEDLCKNFAITDKIISGGSKPGFADVNTGVIIGSCVN